MRLINVSGVWLDPDKVEAVWSEKGDADRCVVKLAGVIGIIPVDLPADTLVARLGIGRREEAKPEPEDRPDAFPLRVGQVWDDWDGAAAAIVEVVVITGVGKDHVAYRKIDYEGDHRDIVGGSPSHFRAYYPRLVYNPEQ